MHLKIFLKKTVAGSGSVYIFVYLFVSFLQSNSLFVISAGMCFVLTYFGIPL